MKAVFADTAFFLALSNPRDQYHRSAAHFNATLRAPMVTTAWVLTEFANAIAASRARQRFQPMLTRLRTQPGTEILPPEPLL